MGIRPAQISPQLGLTSGLGVGGPSQLVVEHEDDSLRGADQEYCTFLFTPPPARGSRHCACTRDVEVRKVWCSWDGQMLLKSREAWVPACTLVTHHPKLTL